MWSPFVNLSAAVTATTITRIRSAERPYLPVVGLAVGLALVTISVAGALDLPLRDPDGIAGPAYVRLPLILALLFALDVVPRTLARTRTLRGMWGSLQRVTAEQWPRERLKLALVGLLSFYVTYVAYRNLKSFLPFVQDSLADEALLNLDRLMAFGYDPADLLHGLLGTGVAAHALSAVYVFFLLFVPISLAAALVWSRDARSGYWYVTALCANWALGVLSYYLLPSLGPAFASPDLYTDLPVTGASRLQDALWQHRIEVLANPNATHEVHGIAGFASLHVSIVFTAALVAHFVSLHRLVRWALWTFFGLTCVATIYFGWHYIIDDVAGLAIGAGAVWLGALATGNLPLRRRRPAPSG